MAPRVVAGQVVTVRGKQYVFGGTSADLFNLFAEATEKGRDRGNETIDIAVGDKPAVGLFDHVEYEDVKFSDLLRAVSGA